jgi:hypothetical protein
MTRRRFLKYASAAGASMALPISLPAASTATLPEPFTIYIPQPTLDDLRERLRATRWPNAISGRTWEEGTNLEYLQQLVDYWWKDFDWREQERKLNQLSQFRITIRGLGLHYIHEKGRGPHPYPLILSHGWPSTAFDQRRLIGQLTDPAALGRCGRLFRRRRPIPAGVWLLRSAAGLRSTKPDT